jgi:hypothetical protein
MNVLVDGVYIDKDYARSVSAAGLIGANWRALSISRW